jgi:DsbC/DsbD-like thiol-disulfide interchange protein
MILSNFPWQGFTVRLLTFGFFFLLALLPLAAMAQDADHAKVELLSETSALIPGKPVTLGLHFTMDKGWHIYWKNPGDAGLATSVSWKLSAGFKAGKILWPTPQVLPFPSVTDFGYENETLLMVPVKVPENLKPGETFTFAAKVQWLVCNQICIPGEADLHLEIPVASGVTSGADNPLFASTRQTLPVRLPKTWKASGTLDAKQFVLTFQTAASGAFFFPSTPIQIDNNAPQTFETAGSGFTLTVKRSDQLTADVQKLAGVLVVKSADGKQTGYEVTIPLSQSK